MNIIDIIILILLVGSIFKGYKNGLIKEALGMVAYIFSILLAYSFKGYFALFFMSFIKLPDLLAGLDSIRIMVSETIAFLILWFIFNLFFKMVINIFSSIEKATVAIVTNFLAAALSFVKTYLVIFVVLLTLSFISSDMLKGINEANSTKMILNKTPFLSDFAYQGTKDLKELITKLTNLSKDGGKIDFNNLDLVEEFVKNNPGLVSTIISPEMVIDMLGDDVSLSDINAMVKKGGIDIEVISTLITEDVVNQLFAENVIDVNEVKSMYENKEIDPELVKIIGTAELFRTLINQGLFSVDEVQRMYDNGEIEGSDIERLLEDY